MPYQRNGTWYTCATINGRQVRKALKDCPNRKAAESVEAKWKLETFQGKHLQIKKEKRLLFKDFIGGPEDFKGAPYYEGHAKEKESFDEWLKHVLNKLVRFFGNLYMDEITFSKVMEYKQMASKQAPVGVNRHIKVLHHIFETFIKWEKKKGAGEIKHVFPSYNPADDVPDNPESPREVNLTNEEIKKVLNFSSPVLWDVIVIALLTGMRVGEIQNIAKADIDFFHNSILIPKNKSRSLKSVKGSQSIPMCDTVRGILSKYMSLPKDKPFGFPVEDHFVKIRERAGFTKEALHFHDFRHVFATRLYMLKVSKHTISELLRHKIKGSDGGSLISNIYIGVIPDDHHEALKRLEAYFLEHEVVHGFVHGTEPNLIKTH